MFSSYAIEREEEILKRLNEDIDENLISTKYLVTDDTIQRVYPGTSINEIKDEFNENLKFLGCFITMDNSTTVNKEIKKALKDLLGEKMLDTHIRQNISVVESTFEQKPVIYYKSKSNASKDYIKLAKEVFKNG